LLRSLCPLGIDIGFHALAHAALFLGSLTDLLAVHTSLAGLVRGQVRVNRRCLAEQFANTFTESHGDLPFLMLSRAFD